MVLERDLVPFWQWLLPSQGSLGALLSFVIIALVLATLALVGGFVVAMVRHGPMVAGDKVYRTVVTGAQELFQISPRRVWALARLAVQESLRRKVLVAFVIFVLILLFAGWFLQTDYQDPAYLHFNFVLTATSYLVLAIALLLSTFSLPADIKSKTIYTVVTKPVRAGEIVLGRMLGFTLIGTVMLLVMGVCSYVFVERALDHSHEVDTATLKDVPEQVNVERAGQSTLDSFHRHNLSLESATESAEEGWYVEPNYGHTHEVETIQRGGRDVLALSGPIGHMQARVPQYGDIRFLDRTGGETDTGISVGNEWTYRSFIEGNSPARAIWQFDNISDSIDEEGLPVVLNVRVFRTHKGVITLGIQGEVYLRNPDTEMQSEGRVFTAKDDQLDLHFFARKLKNTQGEEIDLYDDLVSEDGEIEVWVRCIEPGMYFGFAKPDCYIELENASPLTNFWKAQAGIWVQMVIVIAIGVACSTFVSGPVAMLFTGAFILIGLKKDEFVRIAKGENFGGGAIESAIRMVTQKNMITEFEPGTGIGIVKAIDTVIRYVMQSVAAVLPDFPKFNTARFVAEGFNIPAGYVAQDLVTCLAYVLGLFVIGYFFLRTREVAK